MLTLDAWRDNIVHTLQLMKNLAVNQLVYYSKYINIYAF